MKKTIILLVMLLAASTVNANWAQDMLDAHKRDVQQSEERSQRLMEQYDREQRRSQENLRPTSRSNDLKEIQDMQQRQMQYEQYNQEQYDRTRNQR